MKSFKKFLKESELFDKKIRNSGAKIYKDFVDMVKYAIDISHSENFTFFYKIKNSNIGDAFAIQYSIQELNNFIGDLAHSPLIIAFVMDPNERMAEAQISKMGNGNVLIELHFNKFDLKGMVEELSIEPNKNNLKKFELPMLEVFLKNWKLYKTSFIHEFTHYIDFGRGKAKVDKAIEKGASSLLSDTEKSDEERLKDYYNDAFEYNAYYQEAIFAFETKLENTIELYNKYPNKNTAGLIPYLLQPNNFKKFFYDILDFNKYYINRKNPYINKIIKRAYRYWIELNKEYSVEEILNNQSFDTI